MPVSVRLDLKTEDLVTRLARKKGRTKSAVIRQAIWVLAEGQKAGEKPLRPYDAISHLIGCARGGPPDLSEQTGRKFRRLLLKQGRPR